MTALQDSARPPKNLRSAESFGLLAEAIRHHVGERPAHFFPSPGNWGDSLINHGSRQFLSEFNIRHSEHARAEFDAPALGDTLDTTAVVGGGGGWNRNWSSTVRFTTQLAARYRHVVVLPSSYDVALVREARAEIENATLVSRAPESDDSSFAFCHDMAFFCEPRASFEDPLPYPLIALRRDKERHHSSIDPDRNLDISLLGNADSAASGFFELVGRFDEIFTDRLHVAIAGAMLGKSVRLLDGNYGKNRGVFDGSLRSNYANVRLLSWEEFKDMEIVGIKPVGEPGYGEGGVRA